MENSVNDFNEDNYIEFYNNLLIDTKSFMFFIIYPEFVSEDSEIYRLLHKILHYSSVLCEADRRDEFNLASKERFCVTSLYLITTYLGSYDMKILSKILNIYTFIYYTIIAIFLWCIFG